jgi:Ca2+-binding EF-hand superfamily protein
MTPFDFMRSLLPYRVSENEVSKEQLTSAQELFKLADTDADGLISFSEYLVFITLLGTPVDSWKVSFNSQS